MVVLDPSTYSSGGVGFTVLAFHFWGRGSNPGGDFLFFRKKERLESFWMKYLYFLSKMLTKFVLGPMGQGVYNIIHSCYSIFHCVQCTTHVLCIIYVLCITTNSMPSFSFTHSTQQQALQNQSPRCQHSHPKWKANTQTSSTRPSTSPAGQSSGEHTWGR